MPYGNDTFMKIITYSDLHLEFGVDFQPDADVMILAGDIIVLGNNRPLERLLSNSDKPVLYVLGNHEYYTRTPMKEEVNRFRNWLARHYPQVYLLQDEAVTIDDIHFFGGTMWTDYCNGNAMHMLYARNMMQDYQLIMENEFTKLTPDYTAILHKEFVDKPVTWFEEDLPGTRVVISHHAPVINPHTRYGKSPLRHAFNSLDMIDIIETYQPALWGYGHTHECDDQRIGKTRVISNQRGYPNEKTGFSGGGFDPNGVPISIER